MKTDLSILLDSAFGPVGSMVVYPAPKPGVVTIQRRQRRTAAAHDKPACKAFALADSIYHNMTECEKNIWRRAQANAKISGYDLWMKHAVANITAGWLPPAIPPTPGGFTSGLAPPGPFWIDSPHIKMRPNQTCYGPVTWTYEIRGDVYIHVTINLDLKHHDDDLPFDVLLSHWLLWNDNSSMWIAKSLSRTVSSNAQIDLDFGPYTTLPDITATGVIEISYGNLRQKFVIYPEQPVDIPLHLCSAQTPQMVMAYPAKPIFSPVPGSKWWPRDSALLFTVRTHLRRTSQLRYVTVSNAEFVFGDFTGSGCPGANYHLVGHFDHEMNTFRWQLHTLKGRYTPRDDISACPRTFLPGGRTIVVWAGVAYSFSWIDNRPLEFALTTPPGPEKKP